LIPLDAYDMPPAMESNPFIVILVLKDAHGTQFYRAVSVASSSLVTYNAVLQTVFQFIQYDPATPTNTKTIYGTLVEACVRVCSVPMEQRDPAIKFRIRPLGTIGRSIQSHTYQAEASTEPFILADHFTLF